MPQLANDMCDQDKILIIITGHYVSVNSKIIIIGVPVRCVKTIIYRGDVDMNWYKRQLCDDIFGFKSVIFSHIDIALCVRWQMRNLSSFKNYDFLKLIERSPKGPK